MRFLTSALAVASLWIASCQSGEAESSARAVETGAKTSAKASSFRDIGKRSASDLTLR